MLSGFAQPDLETLMSRTDKTDPWRIRRDIYPWEWTWGFKNSWKQNKRREHNRQDRARAKRQIRQGEDVEPVQGRNRAIWDSW